MKLLIQLEENKNGSDNDEICLPLNFHNTHTIYSHMTDFGGFLFHPSFNFDLTLFML